MASIAIRTGLEKLLSEKIDSPSGDTDSVSSVSNTTRIVLVVEYNGSHYYGFQLQAKLPSIQGEIERALKRLTGDRTRVLGASRTDSGVHARGQVVSFRTRSQLSPRTFINGLNYYLPGDIAVREAYRADDAFNIRSHAISREYRYYILNRPTRSPLWEGFSYLVSGGLDIEAMNRACQALVGEHDFASFASNLEATIKSTWRRVYHAAVSRDGELVIFNIVANSFLPHQVRNTVGALVRVGLGRMTPEEFYSIIEAKKIGLAGPAAPASGLYLMKVNYRKAFKEDDSENL
jgi:tRNA pseudouridine38-40 synthase